MRRVSWWSGLAIILALVADLAVVANVGLPWRGLAVFAFLLVGPGLPLARLLRLRSAFVSLTLAVASSLALDMAVAVTMVMANVWSAGTALAVLIFVAVTGSLVEVVAATRRKDSVAVG